MDDDDISGDVDAVLNREDNVGARCGVVGVRVNFWFKCSSDTIPIGDVRDGEFHVIVTDREVDLVEGGAGDEMGKKWNNTLFLHVGFFFRR